MTASSRHVRHPARWHALRVATFVDYGLNIAASGAITAMYRQDVFANNLANMDTVGFKPDIPQVRQRPAANVEDHLNLPSNKLLERLGAGVLLAPNRISLTQGAPRSSSNPMDLAIEGDGFFVVRAEGDSQGDNVRLTRDGRFLRSSSGNLVNQRGLPVLDVNNRPINIPGSGELRIDPDGTVVADGSPVAQIKFISIESPEQLVKDGDSLMKLDARALENAKPAKGGIRQYAVEESAVDEVRTLMQVSSASREADAAFGLISQLDRINERVINSFGRVT